MTRRGDPSRLDWYLEVESDGMGLAYSPSDAPASAHQAVVATESILTFRDNFQSDNGWTVPPVADRTPKHYHHRRNAV